MTETVNILKALSGISGVSGDEQRVRDAIISEIKGYCEYSIDPLGNLLCRKKGKKQGKKLMLSAHMDEVGFIITNITEEGLLRFSSVGGIDSRVIVGKAVEIGENALCGVIGAKVLHHLEEKERDEPLSADKLYIDIGAVSREDALKHVKQGDRAVFLSEFETLGKDKILGRAFDDRAGCAILISLIKSELDYDCDFAFTVQEETGCTGAVAASYTLSPDISIVVEATTAADVAGVEPTMQVCEQGKGGVISFMDKGTIYDAELYQLALKTASEYGIPCQSKSGIFGGNDSKSIHVSKSGVRAMAVSLPCRYLHTASCVLDTKDIESALLLLKKLIPAVCAP